MRVGWNVGGITFDFGASSTRSRRPVNRKKRIEVENEHEYP